MKKLIAFILAMLCCTTAFAEFSDMSEHEWAREAVESLTEKEVINGISETEFMPRGEVTYEQLSKLIVSAFDLKPGDEGGRWADKYIASAKQYFMGEYEYGDAMPRYEVVSAITRVYTEKNNIEPKDDVQMFFDVAVISANIGQKYIATAQSLGITEGDGNGYFRPYDNVSRAETAVLIYRTLNLKTTEVKETMADVKKILITMENYDTMELELYPQYAPITVANFVSLVREGFYDGLTFHRVIPGFMIQGGDPLGNGTGGSDTTIKGEFAANGFTQNTLKHERGVISMARSSLPDSASSQFFIMHEDAPYLDGQYAAFGRVVSGIETVDNITKYKTDAADKPLKPVVIKSIEVIE